MNDVAPVRERGLKYALEAQAKDAIGRSRKGAWIEIHQHHRHRPQHAVAPVRERGLKSPGEHQRCLLLRRSRKGAWIEMTLKIVRCCRAWSLP